MAKIKLKIGGLQIETETTYRQLFVLGIFLVFILEIVNMYTIKLNRDILQYGILIITNMCTSLLTYETTSKIFRRRRK
ncbi:MAG: hypothetical protein QXV82_09330 [Ignisphaera sp.]